MTPPKPTLLTYLLTSCLALACWTNSGSVTAAPTDLPWPAAPRGAQHNLGYGFADLRDYGVQAPAHFHGAIDIVTERDAYIVAPITGKLSAGYYSYCFGPMGYVRRYEFGDGDRGDYELAITTPDGYRFELRHVNPDSLSVAALAALENQQTIAAGTVLGTVEPWRGSGPMGADFTHIHYRVVAPNGEAVNPQHLSQPIAPDTTPPKVHQVVAHFSEGGVALDESLHVGPDLTELILQVSDHVDGNIYRQAPAGIELSFSNEVVFGWDSREFMRLHTGEQPSVADLYAFQTTLPSGTILTTEAHHLMQRYLFRIPIPQNRTGHFEIRVYDHAGNQTKLTGNVDPMQPRFPDRAAPARPALSTCRQHIATAVCVVDPPEPGSNPADRTCLGGEARYVEVLERSFDRLPPVMQQMFCAIDRINIENRLFGTAYGGMRTDQMGRITGAEIGLRRTAIDAELTFEHWASWKEQLSFGANREQFDLIPGLPSVRSTFPDHPAGFLDFLLMHELAHIFDHVNRVNQFENCRPQIGCALVPGSFGAISWERELVPLQQEDFTGRADLCFYRCDDTPIDRNRLDAIYDGLLGTSFLSLYAATEPDEDFAETAAFYFFAEHYGVDYRVELPGRAAIDFTQRLVDVPQSRAKRDFVDRFFANPYLRYPPWAVSP